MAKIMTDYAHWEWPNGCPGAGRPIPKRWERDRLYREECLDTIHLAMNADAIEAMHKAFREQMLSLHEQRSQRGKEVWAKYVAEKKRKENARGRRKTKAKK